jgi:hypothetical protein
VVTGTAGGVDSGVGTIRVGAVGITTGEDVTITTVGNSDLCSGVDGAWLLGWLFGLHG